MPERMLIRPSLPLRTSDTWDSSFPWFRFLKLVRLDGGNGEYFGIQQIRLGTTLTRCYQCLTLAI